MIWPKKYTKAMMQRTGMYENIDTTVLRVLVRFVQKKNGENIRGMKFNGANTETNALAFELY